MCNGSIDELEKSMHFQSKNLQVVDWILLVNYH
jgi:hypothetical protein